VPWATLLVPVGLYIIIHVMLAQWLRRRPSARICFDARHWAISTASVNAARPAMTRPKPCA